MDSGKGLGATRCWAEDAAVEAVADAIRRTKAGLSDAARPLGSFLFLGTHRGG
ncbi:hypothetical protein MASR2M78_16810 [Treponema sp.]